MSELAARPVDPVVGTRVAHSDAALHPTGAAVYTDDLAARRSDVLTAWPVQSEHAHALVTLDVEGSYDISAGALQDQRYRLGYNTQCCGMIFELARRDYTTIDEAQYRFMLNLRGVGTFLDLQGRPH